MRDMSACSFFFPCFLLLLERVYTRTRASAVTNAVFLAVGCKTAQPVGAKSSGRRRVGRRHWACSGVRGIGWSGAIGGGGLGKTAAGCWKTPDSILRGRRGRLLQARRRLACLPRPEVRHQGRTWPRSRCWVRPPAAGVEPPPR